MQLKALRQCCHLLGIDPASQGKETQPRYHLDVTMTAGNVHRLKPEDLSSMVSDFGDALSFRIEQGDFVFVSVSGGEAPGLGEALDRLARLDQGDPLRLVLDLDKRKLLDRVVAKDSTHHVIPYLFARSLLDGLDVPLLALDGALFVGRHKPTVLVALEGDLCYDGRFLNVVSLEHLGRLPEVLGALRPIDRSVQRRIDRYHRVASQDLNRGGFQFQHLTPLHFLRSRDGDASTEICSILRRHLCHLCILYTANRSVHAGDVFRADYSSPIQTVTLELTSTPVPAEKSDALSRLALWPYSGEGSDRLTILQNVVARELQSARPSESYHGFVERIDHILGEARWHHRIFVGQEIDQHFEQVQDLVSYVAGIAGKLSAAIDTTTKGLTDALLGATGVVVLSLLATLLKGENQGILFRIGLWAYSLYLFLFQGLYRLGSIWHSYHLLCREAGERLEVYAAKLGRDRVQALLAPLVRRKRQFKTWFWLSVGVYVAVIAAMLVAGLLLPPYLVSVGVLPPPGPVATPVPTPASTPVPPSTWTPTPTA